MFKSETNPICGPPHRLWVFAAVLFILTVATPSFAQWAVFIDKTAERSSSEASVWATDVEEKDYDVADVDRDGDLDLVVVRKQPVTSAGKRTNVLMMNVNGVLTNRTAEFATDTDVPGDMGFLTPTNDRDVEIADLNNDGWLDMITTTAISNGDPKHIGHPRIYMNKGCSVGGGTSASSCTDNNWLGFRFENSRIPALLSDSGAAGFNPCFCAVSAGDVTGDGYADLYFTDYDSQCEAADFNDKLLINQGVLNPGFFTDVTETNFIAAATGFPVSAFGASNGIAHFNNDGELDILKQFAGFVGVAYNMPSALGVFDRDNSPYGGAAYFVNYGDLNNDNKLDLVVADDGQDRYLLNQGTGGDDLADFISFAYTYQHQGAGGPAADDGFGGNVVVADLNNDGWNDVLVTDVDVDVAGCGRRTHIYRNLGGTPGGNVTLQEQTQGTGCQNFLNNPATCTTVGIPVNKLVGTHDIATIDINGDGWDDMVVGRCSGTQVYMNVPPFPPAGGIPDGDTVPGTGLLLDKTETEVLLNWDPSCNNGDDDYAVYVGALIPGSNFTNHGQVACTTNGVTSFSRPIEGAGFFPSSYYLVAPRNDTTIGSLGENSNGIRRSQGVASCAIQLIGECE